VIKYIFYPKLGATCSEALFDTMPAKVREFITRDNERLENFIEDLVQMKVCRRSYNASTFTAIEYNYIEQVKR
jgi:mitochondrial fission protein ELM1